MPAPAPYSPRPVSGMVLPPPVDPAQFQGLSQADLRAQTQQANVTLGTRIAGLDPATVPTEPLWEIVARCQAALQGWLDQDGIVEQIGDIADAAAGVGLAGKWQPQAAELEKLQAAVAAGQDTPLLRQRARDLLISLGSNLASSPVNMQPDSGDSFARQASLQRELEAQAALYAEQARDLARDTTDSLLWGLGAFAGVLALTGIVILAVYAERKAQPATIIVREGRR